MGKKLNERVGALEYDELIIGSHPVADVVLVDLAAGSGIIKRGTVIIGDPGGTFAPIAAAASAAGTKEGQGCEADKYADSCAHA